MNSTTLDSNYINMASVEGEIPKNLLCFSHLRWDFVYQRPQHLMSRFSDMAAVYFFEEPILLETEQSYLVISKREDNLWVCVPHISNDLSHVQVNSELALLLDFFFLARSPEDFIFWYYTPMALEFSQHITAGLTVYDCMDELSAFKFAPVDLKSLEHRLFRKADIVFTGGNSLFEEKKRLHKNILPFPSSIDKNHFYSARQAHSEPKDQACINGIKIGFYGVIDERFDLELIASIADSHADWNIVIIGPVVKIDPESLPQRHNIFYLGPKNYQELPFYLSGWDVAMVPFLINESTRFVSPTKTPEYLCAGCPVVSTPIQDIINPYGSNNLVSIANNNSSFIEAVSFWLNCKNKNEWLSKADEFLVTMSWDITFANMVENMSQTYLVCQDDNRSSMNIPYMSLKRRA